MAHFEFVFKNLESEKSELLIALLNEIQFEGFLEEEGNLKAYIKEENFDNEAFQNLIVEHNLDYTKDIVQETNWNAEWESSFEPIDVFHPLTGELFAHVRASFHQPKPKAKHDLIITPKMSFGTGHHATTFQMMEQMIGLDFTGKNIIDFGTGTGLLSILAEKMGAADIKAIDNDIWSINNTRENITANNCHHITVIQAEHCLSFDTKADILLANINLNVILSNLSNICKACHSESIVLFSGILTEDESTIINALKVYNYDMLEIHSKNNWLVIVTKVKKTI
jgi:ribosomal protein L11 methyltransferase